MGTLFYGGLICLMGLLIAPRQGVSQNLVFPLDTFRQVVRAQVDVVRSVDTILEGKQEFAGRLRQISAYQEGVPVWDSTAYFIQDPLQLDRGDLILAYHLPQLLKPDEFYEVSVTFRLNGNPIIPEPENLRGDVGARIQGGPGSAKKAITWVNLLENYINISDTLEMELTIVLNGLIPGCLEINCADGKPERDWNYYKPLLYTGIGGAVLIGVGQIFDSRSDDVYEDYREPKLSQSEADELYADANRKHKTYLALTYAGTAVLVADAVWFLVKELRIRRDRRLYEECCRGTALQWRPVMNIPASGSAAYAGLQVKINF